MTGAVVGYGRTSTSDQQAGLEAQIAELEAAGATKVFQEHVSSVDAQRPQLRAALDWVRDGDTFMVTKPDRLARNVTDLLRIVEDLKARNVTVRIMSMGVDTSTATGVLILQVLGAVSQWERSVMLERQRHGIAKAKADGKYRGRAPTARAKTPEVMQMKAEGKTVAQIAKSVGISRASVYRAFAEAA
jgi:DNA invertase Pin-like site-specific DNA recombinase